MIYGLLADLITALHLAFVVFMVLGGLLLFRWPRLIWIHLPAVCWGVYVELAGRVCPLTPLEVWLRWKGGSAGYSGGFIEHYVLPVLYPPGLTQDLQLLLGGSLVAINLLIYLAYRAFRRRSR